jgi:sensor domain CHASE-containing protein
MPPIRQILISVLLLALAIAVVAGIALRNAVAHPLNQQDSERAAAQMFSVEMGLSADLPGAQLP